MIDKKTFLSGFFIVNIFLVFLLMHYYGPVLKPKPATRNYADYMQNLRKQENQNKIKIEIITQKPDSLINKLFPTTTVKTAEENEEGECVYDMDHLKLVGKLAVSFDEEPPTFEELEKRFPEIQPGGYFKPKCKTEHKNAIILPYRNRERHLRWFLNYLHPMLMRQNVEYRIYIVNQAGMGQFNRAKLLNIGYVESQHDIQWRCFTFHDVDLIPEDDRILYTCPFNNPRHLSRGVDKFKYVLPYADIFGGASQLTKEQFVRVNGYPNRYYGWGGEDDEMAYRINNAGFKKIRYPASIARYKMIRHSRDKGNEPNPKRIKELNSWKKYLKTDGLNSLTYKVLETTEHKLYTNITVDVLQPHNR